MVNSPVMDDRGQQPPGSHIDKPISLSDVSKILFTCVFFYLAEAETKADVDNNFELWKRKTRRGNYYRKRTVLFDD